MAHRGVHEFNTSFTWQRPIGPFRTLTDAQIDSYDENGYFVLPDAFAAETVEAMTAQIDPIETRVSAALGRRIRNVIAPTEYTVTSHLVMRSELLGQVCGSGVLATVATDLLGADVRLYWDQSVYKKPHSLQPFPWHQDNGKVFIEPQQYITCWIALTDATEENGCPVITPGLHHAGTLRHWMGDDGWKCLDGPVDGTPVPMRAGSVAVFSSVTVHMSNPNHTGMTRKAYVVQYAPVGAVAIDRAADGSLTRSPQDADDRQFRIETGAGTSLPCNHTENWP